MIRIIGDTTSGLTLAQAKELGIEFIPQIVVFGEDSYRDDTEIDSATFVQKLLEAKELPKTAAPPPALYTPIYKDMLEKGDSAIVICPSAQLSGTTRSATTAMYDFPDLDIRIIDTEIVGSGIAQILQCAKQWVDEGKSIDEVEELVRNMVSKAKVYGVVDTLEFLHKGGRIGGAAKLFGDVLQIKPILTIVHGRVESFEKQRTKKKALSRLIEIVEGQCKDYQEGHFSFSIFESEAEQTLLRKEFSERFGAEVVPCLNVPPAIMVHAGPGVILCCFFTE